MSAEEQQLRNREASKRIEPTRFHPPRGGPRLPGMRVPWARLLTLAAFAFVLLGVWYVLVARSVALTVDPTEASVRVQSVLAPRFSGRWLLLRGEHRVQATAPGYYALDEPLPVNEQSHQTYHFSLTPLPGSLRLDLTPDVEAEVRIDGEVVGSAPGRIDEVAAGDHEILVSAARYLPYSTLLLVEGRGREQRLQIRLEPAWADFAIATQPLGATISVDGDALGQTPLNSELIHGARTITATLPGYKPWSRRIIVTAGQAVTISDVRLEKADGHLAIKSAPSHAAIRVDGKYRGETPLNVAVEPDTGHEIRINLAGYQTAQRRVNVGSGNTREVSFNLAPELATVQLITTPDDAELLLDGEPRGSATQTLSLPTREHEIIIRKAGYATYKTTVKPRRGIEKRMKIRLKTLAEMTAETTRKPPPSPPPAPARPGVVPPIPVKIGQIVRTAAGQELKLFRGGEFKMGSSRREADRRANEGLHDVTLTRPFYLSLREVTNSEYRRLVSNHTSGSAYGLSLDDDQQPVVNLTWEAAATYCNWLSRRESLIVFYQIKYGKVLGINPDANGYRLPTEAEWEWAARGADKSKRDVYPWSGGYPPAARAGNFADASAKSALGRVIPGYNDGYAVSAPVGSFAANSLGLYDLAGNVAEWTHDVYSAIPGSVNTNPLGPQTGNSHVVRGSSWSQGERTMLRTAYRDFAAQPRQDLGFRLARYAQ